MKKGWTEPFGHVVPKNAYLWAVCEATKDGGVRVIDLEWTHAEAKRKRKHGQFVRRAYVVTKREYPMFGRS